VTITDALVWTSLHVPTGNNDTSLTREVISFPTVEKVKFWCFHSSFVDDLCLLGSECLPDVLKENTALRTPVTTSPTAHCLILHHLNPYRNFNSLLLLQSAGTPVQNYKHHIHHDCSINTHYAVLNGTRWRTEGGFMS